MRSSSFRCWRRRHQFPLGNATTSFSQHSFINSHVHHQSASSFVGPIGYSDDYHHYYYYDRIPFHEIRRRRSWSSSSSSSSTTTTTTTTIPTSTVTIPSTATTTSTTITTKSDHPIHNDDDHHHHHHHHHHRPVWSEEWKRLGLGATCVDTPTFPPNLFFVQIGFGVDQHGDRTDATKAAIRAVRNAIEFNSIPGVSHTTYPRRTVQHAHPCPIGHTRTFDC